MRSLTILRSFIANLVRRRYLVAHFVLRDLRTRYVGSLMGFFWAVIHPLVLLSCYSLVFSGILNVQTKFPQINDNFAVFLFCGLLPWLYFQDTLQRSCDSVVQHANLIRKTAFPSEILPLTIVLSNLVTHLIGLGILLAVLIYFGTPGWCLLLLPLYWLLAGLLALGLGWIAAPLQVFVRDTSQVLAVVLTFWFWVTPIFYQLEQIPQPLRPWLALNPVRLVVEGYRAILIENRLPDWRQPALLAAFAVAAFLVGGFVFRNTKREFADVL